MLHRPHSRRALLGLILLALAIAAALAPTAARAQTVSDTSGIFKVTETTTNFTEFELHGSTPDTLNIAGISYPGGAYFSDGTSGTVTGAGTNDVTVYPNSDYSVDFSGGSLDYTITADLKPGESSPLTILTGNGPIDIQNVGGTYTASYDPTFTTVAAVTPELGSGVSFALLLACLAVSGGAAKLRKNSRA